MKRFRIKSVGVCVSVYVSVGVCVTIDVDMFGIIRVGDGVHVILT